jgi:urease accessory protein
MSAVPVPVRRAVRIGVGGPVGVGKTALLERMVLALIARGLEVAVVALGEGDTADAERLRASGLIRPDRVVGVASGARHGPAAARALDAALALQAAHPALDLVLVEAPGAGLDWAFPAGLVDRWLFIVDAAAGDALLSKDGAGPRGCDLLVLNRVDLGPMVGVDVDALVRGARARRAGRPLLATDCASGAGVDAVVAQVARWRPDHTNPPEDT